MSIIVAISFLPWYLLALIYGIIVTIVPGPVMILTLRYALRKNLKQVFFCLSGMFLGEMIYLTTVLVGYHVYLIEKKIVLDLIAIAGGIFVIIIGLQIFSAAKPKVISSSEPRVYHVFIKCFLITLSNPAILLILLVALKFYDEYYSHQVKSLIFFLFIELGSLLYSALVIYLFYNAKIMQTKRGLYSFDKVVAVLLIILGVFILYDVTVQWISLSHA